MTAPRNDLTAEYVRSILDYDPETGVFTWKWREDAGKYWNARFSGKTAGCARPSSNGKAYHIIGVNSQRYRAHRLAWLIMTGEWPEDEIDHRDGDGLNNRISNLRTASRTQNNQNVRCGKNNKTGFKGVYWDKRNNKWRAEICAAGQKHSLGYFDTPEGAYAAYVAAAESLHGEFARVA